MSAPFVGQLMLVGFNFAPRGWAFCNGQLLAVSQNDALFSLLGTIYGGDGRTTFALPDLRGRTAIQSGSGPGLSPRNIGSRGGRESIGLTASQMPQHTHLMNVRKEDGNIRNPKNDILAASKTAGGVNVNTYSNKRADGRLQADAISLTGGNQTHTNLDPYLTVSWIISLVGVYPSRS